MDFARKQLEKYGWTDGDGLGKHGTGISTAIKPKLKFDNAGIGHDRAEQFTYHWWENVYNEAADNINIKNKDDSIIVELNNTESVNITTSKYSKKNNKSKNGCEMEYGTFLKKGKLTPTGVIQTNNDEKSEDEDYVSDLDDGPKKSINNSGINSLTDEQLFAACGGRTAHKGARHGLNLKGKLARIEEQERQLLEKLQSASSITNSNQFSSEKITNCESTRATERFLQSVNMKSLSVPSKKSSKKQKCLECGHKRCRCNDVFDDPPNPNRPIQPGQPGQPPTCPEPSKQKRRLCDDIDNKFRSKLGINSVPEQLRETKNKCDSSPYSEMAHNKRRRMGVSSVEEEYHSGELISARTLLKVKRNKIRKQMKKLSNSLEKINMDD